MTEIFQMFTKLFLTSFRCSHVIDEQVILAPCPHASGGELQLLQSFVDIDRSQVFLSMAILSLSLTLHKYNSQFWHATNGGNMHLMSGGS